MSIISKDEVKKEMGVVPGELLYDFYIRKVTYNEIVYTPIETSDMLKHLSK